MREIRLPTDATRRRSQAAIPLDVDVAIVGAGLGGLGAAAPLARAGLKVAVFDSHYVVGGCASMFARGSSAERYLFDVGFHYVGDAGPGGGFERALGPLGIAPEFVPLDEDGFDVLLFPDFEFRTPVGVEAYRERLVEHFPAERRGIDRWVRFLIEADGLIAAYGRARGKHGVTMLKQALLHGRLASFWIYGAIGPFLQSCTRDPQLRAVLMGPHGNYALPPSRVSALMHAGLAMHYLRGAYYVRGGGQALSESLADAVEAAGGSVHLQTPVLGIATEGGRAVGLRVEPRGGEPVEIRARAVVSGADLPHTLLDLLPAGTLPPRVQAKAERWEFPDGVFVTSLAVRDDLAARGFGRCNYWQFDGYDVEAMYSGNVEASRPRVTGSYMTSATRKDEGSATHAPGGVHTVELMTAVRSDPAFWGLSHDDARGDRYRKHPAYLEAKQAVEDELMARFERRFPGVSEHVIFQESSTPMSHRRFTGALGGSGYGLSATPAQFGPNRPGYRTPVPRLYVCGASTRSGHGILGALASGGIVGDIVQRDLSG